MLALEENGVRAAIYGVLAHLLYAAPSPSLLQQVAGSRDVLAGGALPLAAAWQQLCAVCGTADAAALRSEFDTAFVSTGNPPVSLYASSYMSGRQRGQLLAELREDLAGLGYVRAEDSGEYEDHLAALCEVMRGLIGEENDHAGAFGAQKLFFGNYIGPWYGAVCESMIRAEQTAFYREVARFANAFFTNESGFFELA
jgi:TorA maturation chaperone TorD